jgi:hypothetical protein
VRSGGSQLKASLGKKFMRLFPPISIGGVPVIPAMLEAEIKRIAVLS